jgi:hypothetical protein
MANCNPCIIEDCFPNQLQECKTGSSGGYQKLWMVNACHIAGLTYETVNGIPRARVSGLTLTSGQSIKEVNFPKQRGIQLDSAPQSPNPGIANFATTAIIPYFNYEAETMANVMKIMRGAEVVLIGLHNDGNYYIAGSDTRGLEFDGENNQGVRGRVPDDDNIGELSLSLTDNFGLREFLLGNTTDDKETRRVATKAFIDQLVDCGTAILIVTVTTSQPLTFDQGAGDTGSANVSIGRDGCDQDITLAVKPGHTLPSGITVADVTVPAANDTATIDIVDDGTAAAGNYTIPLVATASGCTTDDFTIDIQVS